MQIHYYPEQSVSKSAEQLIRLIKHKDTFHDIQNKELNSILMKSEPQRIPSEHRKEVAKTIEMTFLTENVLSENRVHIDRMHRYLTNNTMPC